MTATKNGFPRSAAVHEAGHAVVAWSFELPVGALWVNADDASGGAEVGLSPHLKLTEQIAICWGGVAAQSVFNAPGHELAAFKDHEAIMDLLEAHDISEADHGPTLRAEGYEIATGILEANRSRVNALVERLVERGRIEGLDFLSLMNGQV
jgi:ATP-dependent Zn protease